MVVADVGPAAVGRRRGDFGRSLLHLRLHRQTELGDALAQDYRHHQIPRRSRFPPSSSSSISSSFISCQPSQPTPRPPPPSIATRLRGRRTRRIDLRYFHAESRVLAAECQRRQLLSCRNSLDRRNAPNRHFRRCSGASLAQLFTSVTTAATPTAPATTSSSNGTGAAYSDASFVDHGLESEDAGAT